MLKVELLDIITNSYEAGNPSIGGLNSPKIAGEFSPPIEGV
jgi:hypothetical protein